MAKRAGSFWPKAGSFDLQKGIAASIERSEAKRSEAKQSDASLRFASLASLEFPYCFMGAPCIPGIPVYSRVFRVFPCNPGNTGYSRVFRVFPVFPVFPYSRVFRVFPVFPYSRVFPVIPCIPGIPRYSRVFRVFRVFRVYRAPREASEPRGPFLRGAWCPGGSHAGSRGVLPGWCTPLVQYPTPPWGVGYWTMGVHHPGSTPRLTSWLHPGHPAPRKNGPLGSRGLAGSGWVWGPAAKRPDSSRIFGRSGPGSGTVPGRFRTSVG